jgi:hypothetical protein
MAWRQATWCSFIVFKSVFRVTSEAKKISFAIDESFCSEFSNLLKPQIQGFLLSFGPWKFSVFVSNSVFPLVGCRDIAIPLP